MVSPSLLAYTAEALRAVENRCKVTEAQLDGFLLNCYERYLTAKIEPGAFFFHRAVGLVLIGPHISGHLSQDRPWAPWERSPSESLELR
jgi:hypothetical protein